MRLSGRTRRRSLDGWRVRPLARPSRGLVFALAPLVVVATVGPVSAQPAPVDEPPAAEPAPAGESGPTVSPVADDAELSRIHALEARLERQGAELETLRQAEARRAEQERERAAQEATLSERVTQLEEANAMLVEQLQEEDQFGRERLLSAWGFFDVTLAKTYLSPRRGPAALVFPVDATFFMSGINLYLKSQMTRSLSTMIETRLTFMPHGYESDWVGELHVGGDVSQFGQYTRENTTVQGPYPTAPHRVHGMVIERAHFDWEPRDWFHLRVGRFLTPYGLWNTDHGAPVLIGVLPPSLMTDQYIPSAQTGLQISSSLPITDTLGLSTALTISNGRGPFDEVLDSNDHKAVGLGATVDWTPGELHVTAGSYGLLNKYSDRTESAVVELGSDMTLDSSAETPIRARFETTEEYDEAAISGALRVTGWGLTLASEVVLRRVLYDTPAPAEYTAVLVSGAPAGTDAYSASFVGYAYYVLAAYELPLGNVLRGLRIAPYLGFDQVVPDTNQALRGTDQYRAGLNLKPSSYVTLKMESLYNDFRAEELGTGLGFFAQLAVAF